jgi:tetratricopeptide (TPR) repeat protein
MNSVHNELSGTANGNSVQAGSVHGGIHFHQVLNSVVIPRQLPASVPDFVGRQTELARLANLLEASANVTGTVLITAINGTAGVGKTALAVRWAHQVSAHFPDGHLYVNLRGFDPTAAPLQPAEVVRGFLDAFGVPPERISINPDAQVAMYRSLLAGRRVLIVLDNARDAEQVRPLLPGSSTCLVIVTSRNQLTGLIAHEGARPVTIDVLEVEEAFEFLSVAFGPQRVDGNSSTIQELIRQCAQLPLALAIVAARAATNVRLTPQLLVDELRDELNRLDALETGDPDTDLRAVFSWSYGALQPESARIFRLLGLHTASDITLSAAASLGALSVQQARNHIAGLVRANLIEEHVPGRFRFHDLLRAYAAEQALRQESDDQRRVAIHRLLDYYLHSSMLADKCLHPHRVAINTSAPLPGIAMAGFETYEQAMLWFASEHGAILAVLEQAVSNGFHCHAWQLPWGIVNYLDRRGHWYDYVTSQETAAAAADQLGDRTALAASLRLLGNGYSRLERHEDSFKCLARALTVYRDLDDVVGQATTHHAISRAYTRQGDHERALDEAICALELFRETDHLAWLARVYNRVGQSYAFLGNHNEALRYCTEAMDLLRGLGDRYNEARTLNSLGYIHHQLEHYDLAIRNYQESIDVHRELGDDYYEAITFVQLGDVYSAIDDSGAAGQAWGKALGMFELQHHPDAEQVRVRLAGLFRETSEPSGPLVING